MLRLSNAAATPTALPSLAAPPSPLTVPRSLAAPPLASHPASSSSGLVLQADVGSEGSEESRRGEALLQGVFEGSPLRAAAEDRRERMSGYLALTRGQLWRQPSGRRLGQGYK